MIRVGSASESVTPKRRAEVKELAALLRDDDRSVAIEERERIPERYGVVWAETVAIFIGTATGSGLIGAMVTDVYNTAKRWARDQWKKKTEAHPGGCVPVAEFYALWPGREADTALEDKLRGREGRNLPGDRAET